MFVKMIRFRDVRPGDVICKEAHQPREVGAVSKEQDPYVDLFIRDGGLIMGRPEEIIGLIHRPWPDGKTEQDMLKAIFSIIKKIPTVSYGAPKQLFEEFWSTALIMCTPELGEAIDAYELGKPQEPDPMIPIGRVPLLPTEPR